MRLFAQSYNSDPIDLASITADIPVGYTLEGVAYAKDFPNTCHNDKPILILVKDSKYYAMCACGANLTETPHDCGNDALAEFRNKTR